MSKNYHVIFSEELYFIKYPLLNFTKYEVTFEELKVSTIKRHVDI